MIEPLMVAILLLVLILLGVDIFIALGLAGSMGSYCSAVQMPWPWWPPLFSGRPPLSNF